MCAKRCCIRAIGISSRLSSQQKNMPTRSDARLAVIWSAHQSFAAISGPDCNTLLAAWPSLFTAPFQLGIGSRS